jgi:peptide/nickel transport system ATP-binding protein
MTNMADANAPLLQVEDLRVYYGTGRGPVRAVDGITFTVKQRERFGLVGESGCGKSTTAMAILRLIKPPGRIESGRILLEDEDLIPLSKEEMRQVRWQRIALVPQGAMNSLNPIMRIREQIGDAIETHEDGMSRQDLSGRIRGLLDQVELPGRVADLYPHELSGGMKQRVCIAMATALSPQLIIADEPTSALDVVVQRAVMQTLIDIQEQLGSSLIFIGHDMGLTAQVVNRIGVMYAGKLMEVADIREVYKEPLHPYTQALIASLPSVKEKRKKVGIPGLPPFLLNPPPGCIFHPRCQHAMDICKRQTPEYRELRPGHFVACHLYNDQAGYGATR